MSEHNEFLAFFFVHTFAMLSTITNPILYGWLNTNLKHLFRAMYMFLPILNFLSVIFFFFLNLHSEHVLLDRFVHQFYPQKSRQNFCSRSSIRSSTYGKKNISDIPSCGKVAIFVTEFFIFLKTSK